MKTRLQHWLFALTFLLTTLSARATTRTVTTIAPGGAGSLWATVQAASLGDTINFQAGLTGTIIITNQLNIYSNLTILGPGATVIALQAIGNSRVFQIFPGAQVNISGLTITGGLNQGANGTSASRNGGNGAGGGIYNSGLLTLMYCAVTNNSAVGGQGYADVSANPIGTGGRGFGGGIYSDGNGYLTLLNCFIGLNSAIGGNGGETSDGSQLYGSGGISAGGGIFSISQLCSLTNDALAYNSVTGGDVVNAGDGTGSGGGISIQDGILVNCTVANNTVTGGPATSGSGPSGAGVGGGIDASSTDSTGVTLKSCTISGNSALGGPDGDSDGNALGGGIEAVQSPAVAVDNTLIASNTIVGGSGGSELLGPDVYGTVASGGYNFIGEANNSTGWTTSGPGADLLGSESLALNPQLGSLQNNGGPTPTMALPPGSPAIDQGKDFGVPFDQRGQLRPVRFSPFIALPAGGDASDIGAFELSAPYLIPVVNSPFIKLTWSETGQFIAGPVPVPPGTPVYANSPVLPNNPIVPNSPIFPGGPNFPNSPFFGLGILSGSLSGGFSAGTAFTGYIRVLNNRQYMAKDIIDPTKLGVVGYGLNNSLTNINLIPAPVTTAATAVTDSGAQLNGTFTPVASNSVYYFVWGYDTTYSLGSTPATPLTTSTTPAYPYASLGSLNASTVYHYQLMTTDSDAGLQVGGDQTFTTQGPPPVIATTGATGVGTTLATLNGTVNGEGYGTACFFVYGTSSGNYTGNTMNHQYYGPYNFTTYPYSTTVTGLVANTTYYFRAAGYGGGGGEQFGAEDTFTTAALTGPPMLVSPGGPSLGGASSSTTPTFVWATNGSPTYDLYLAQYPSGTPQSFTGLTGGSASPATLPPGTTYSWYMTAVDGLGNQSSPSTTFYFTTPSTAPTLVSPGGPSLGGYSPNAMPTFIWNTNGEPTYDLYLAQYPSGAPQEFTGLTGGIAGPTTLQSGTNYSWYVTAVDGYGNQGSPSGTFYFTTPSAPTVQTLTPISTNRNTEVLQGSVNPNGLATTVWFQWNYGTNTPYASYTTTNNVGTTAQNVGIPILTYSGYPYHYRAVANNSLGTSYGGDVQFTAP